MNKKIVTILSFVLLTGCSNNISSLNNSDASIDEFNPYYYIKESNFNELELKVENKEDFIFVISSKYCSWCQKQDDDIFDYMKSNPNDIYYYNIDGLFEDLELDLDNKPINGEDQFNQARKEYRYFASLIEKIGDYILGGEGLYIKDNYIDDYGEKEPSIIYPTTFMYIDGEVNIENSKIGYGWSETENSFKEYIDSFKGLRN